MKGKRDKGKGERYKGKGKGMEIYSDLRKDFVNIFSVFNSVEDDFALCLYLTANPIVAQPYSVIIFIASYFPYIKLASYVLQFGDFLKNQPFYFPPIGIRYIGEIS